MSLKVQDEVEFTLVDFGGSGDEIFRMSQETNVTGVYADYKLKFSTLLAWLESQNVGVDTLNDVLTAGNNAGGLSIKNLLSIIDNSNIASILPNGRVLSDAFAVPVLDWANKQAIDGSANISLDWEQRLAYNALGNLSMDWSACQLIDPTGINSLDWGNYNLIDFFGNPSLNWHLRSTVDSSSVLSYNWDLRLLYDASGNTVADWGSYQLYDGLGSIMFDWLNTQFPALGGGGNRVLKVGNTGVLSPFQETGWTASTVTGPVKGSLNDSSTLADVRKWSQAIENMLFSYSVIHS